MRKLKASKSIVFFVDDHSHLKVAALYRGFLKDDSGLKGGVGGKGLGSEQSRTVLSFRPHWLIGNEQADGLAKERSKSKLRED